jgi:hypothetical protein
MPIVDCGKLLEYLSFTWQQQNSFMQFQLRDTIFPSPQAMMRPTSF